MDTQGLITYLSSLAKNNNKTWFEANRSTYNSLCESFTELAGEVIAGIGQFDPEVQNIRAQDTMFRINRDIRFSADKSPYKTNFASSISLRGRGSDTSGYYFSIEADGDMLVGGGVHQPTAEHLDMIRKYIVAHPAKLTTILNNADFKKNFSGIEGERLKRPPKGYAPDAPHIEILKLKSFTVGRNLSLSTEAPKDLPGYIIATCHAMFPYITWLRDALDM